jgi:hypothetical protein
MISESSAEKVTSIPLTTCIQELVCVAVWEMGAIYSPLTLGYFLAAASIYNSCAFSTSTLWKQSQFTVVSSYPPVVCFWALFTICALAAICYLVSRGFWRWCITFRITGGGLGFFLEFRTMDKVQNPNNSEYLSFVSDHIYTLCPLCWSLLFTNFVLLSLWSNSMQLSPHWCATSSLILKNFVIFYVHYHEH